MSESDVLDLIERRYRYPEWTVIRHARDAAGFGASRTIDAVAFNLWPSRGLMLLGFEVKVYRGDWLRELKQPAKAEVAVELMDGFSVVATKGVVQASEVPKGWGFLEVTGKRLTERIAPTIRDAAATVDRNLAAALFKNLIESYSLLYRAVTPDSEVDRIASEKAEEQVARERHWKEELNERIERFEKSSGIDIDAWDGGRIGEAVRVIRNGGIEEAIRKLKETMAQYERLVAVTRESVKTLSEKPGGTSSRGGTG